MLEVSGALLVSIDGEELALCASGTDIVVEVRRPRRFLRQFGSFGRGRRILRAIAERLNDNGLTLTLARDGIAFMQVGASAPTTLLGRLVGIEHAAFVRVERRT